MVSLNESILQFRLQSMIDFLKTFQDRITYPEIHPKELSKPLDSTLVLPATVPLGDISGEIYELQNEVVKFVDNLQRGVDDFKTRLTAINIKLSQQFNRRPSYISKARPTPINMEYKRRIDFAKRFLESPDIPKPSKTKIMKKVKVVKTERLSTSSEICIRRSPKLVKQQFNARIKIIPKEINFTPSLAFTHVENIPKCEAIKINESTSEMMADRADILGALGPGSERPDRTFETLVGVMKSYECPPVMKKELYNCNPYVKIQRLSLNGSPS